MSWVLDLWLFGLIWNSGNLRVVWAEAPHSWHRQCIIVSVFALPLLYCGVCSHILDGYCSGVVCPRLMGEALPVVVCVGTEARYPPSQVSVINIIRKKEMVWKNMILWAWWPWFMGTFILLWLMTSCIDVAISPPQGTWILSGSPACVWMIIMWIIGSRDLYVQVSGFAG
jgi:hypothetical protein